MRFPVKAGLVPTLPSTALVVPAHAFRTAYAEGVSSLIPKNWLETRRDWTDAPLH